MAQINHNAGDVSSWIGYERRDFAGRVEKMLDRATDNTHQEAQDRVPVDTGALRDSLTRQGHEVYSPLEYAPHVALGTIYQEAQPYLWEAARDVLETEIKRLESA